MQKFLPEKFEYCMKVCKLTLVPARTPDYKFRFTHVYVKIKSYMPTVLFENLYTYNLKVLNKKKSKIQI